MLYFCFQFFSEWATSLSESTPPRWNSSITPTIRPSTCLNLRTSKETVCLVLVWDLIPYHAVPQCLMEKPCIVPFPPTGNGFRNRFCSGFSGSSVPARVSIKDAPQGVTQSTTDVNCKSKTADRIDDLQAFVPLLQMIDRFLLFHCALHHCPLRPLQTNDTPTDVITVRPGKTSYLLVPVWNRLFRFWAILVPEPERNPFPVGGFLLFKWPMIWAFKIQLYSL